MSHQPQLQIYNLLRQPHAKQTTFHPFPLLPTELRLKIWQHAMQRPRLIRIHIYPAGYPDPKPPDHATEKYRVIINGLSALSKLLHINRESREAALGFYRVHIPCEFRLDTDCRFDSTTPGTFHFNPEYDILGIHASDPVRETLVEFLHQLKHTHDPRGIGLLNLAMDGNDLNANDLYALDPADASISAERRRSFTETLTQLRQVLFVVIERVGRQVVGLHSGLLTSETFFNRSLPILSSSTTSFDRLPRDPREIADDLKHVFVGTFDPRGMFDHWGRLLRRWNVASSIVEYRVLLAFIPRGDSDRVRDRGSAERWLLKEDCEWKGEPDPFEDPDKPISAFVQRLRQKNIKWPVGANHPKYKYEDMERAVKPAFGFWLFPLEPLGAVSTAAGGSGLIQPPGYRSEAKRLLDLSAHWPELALFGL
ncbi:hypothetical protein BO94DRAFT_576643 [Aspergillus sclerotioniger CBS 115572]|uniref:2EXR domain-containing protein n=1 Tax=Aspergillus sclerotioniger CBS 115572 TaxID=1450535 RepID=A0A317W8Z3_9EURO|nr:hypothetical protein BO94DRAFT_576643 [Aspergillus sclerotioniger CBS 115572]PWY81712.1 hypothetical protein BO94DRAFT_576643 [Aspergillus sclerotioniger CBS 115572]